MKKGRRPVYIYQLKNEYKAVGYLKANVVLFKPHNTLHLNLEQLNVPNMFDPYPANTVEDGVDMTCYELIYEWKCSVIAHSAVLSSAFTRFNEKKKPSGYKGVNLSVSDIIVIDGTAYMCAPQGWRQVELLDGAGAPTAE